MGTIEQQHQGRGGFVPALVFVGISLGGLLLLLLPPLQEAEAASGAEPISPADTGWWVLVGVIAAQAVTLLWARSAPRLVPVITSTLPLILALATPSPAFNVTSLGVMFGIFLAVQRETLRRLTVVLPATLAIMVVSQYVNDVLGGADADLTTLSMALVQALVVVGGSLIVALFFAARRDARVSRNNEVLALMREHDALVDAAVSKERMAMSRELYDIAAHHMSGITLLASAIHRQVDTDPEAAKASAEHVRAQSKTVLDDLRRVIGLLREETESSRTVETLASIGELVELRRAAGLTIDHTSLTGEKPLGEGIGPLTQLVVYRTVQEALANVAAHAPGAACAVQLDDRGPDSLEVQITNGKAYAPDPGPGSGLGLIGMQERAELIGAELHHGPTLDGGWRVHLTVKKEPA